MSRIKALLDEYGVIYKAMNILPDELKIDFLEALAELEDNEQHDDVIKVIKSKKDRYE